MTNSLPVTAPICCPSSGGGDLLPLLVVVVALLAGHAVLREFQKRKGTPAMKNLRNLAIVAAVVGAAGLVFALKQHQALPAESAPATSADAVRPAALPRLVDLGATKCMQCKMMAPVLEDLKTTYAGQMQVDFIDVWDHPEAGEQYGIRMIPTQILYDAQGVELFRHEGFFPKEDILAKWKEFGVEFAIPEAPNP